MKIKKYLLKKELYDNEWTDALEEITAMGHTEDEAVKYLMEILMVKQCISISV